MKLFLMGLLVAGMQQWVATAAAQGCDEKQKTKKIVVVTDDKAVMHGKCCDMAAHGKCCPKGDQSKCCAEVAHGKCRGKEGHGKVAHGKRCGEEGYGKVAHGKSCAKCAHGKGRCDECACGKKCCEKGACGKAYRKKSKGDGDNVFTIVTTGDGPGKRTHITGGDKKIVRKKKRVKIGGDDECEAVAVVTVVGEGHGDGRSEPGGFWFGTDEGAKKHGWLGVSIDDVSEKLASKLDIEGEGVIVIEVVDDSPADRAGFKTHDIILSIDGDEVEGDTGRAVNLIKTRKPGDEVDVSVLRDGRGKKLSVKLGKLGKGLITIDEDDDEDLDEPDFLWFGDEGETKERGWLGVSIDAVPEALAAQLDIKGKGIIVVDVVDDSPADNAGIKAHDIIMSVDGDGVEGDTVRAVNLIKTRKPGDDVEILVLRDGRKKRLSVELGSRPGPKGLKLKYRKGLPTEIEEKIRTRGKILKKGKDGEWVIKDLGDLKRLKKLPEFISKVVPRSGSRTVQISAEGEQKKITTRVEHDGNIIVVEQEDDGKITVTRVDEDGDETKTVYDDEDELREADEEAYELYEEAGDAVVIHLDLDGLGEYLEDFDFKFDVDDEDWEEHAEDWGRHVDEGLHEAREAYEKGMKQFHQAMEQLRSHRGLPDDIEIPKLSEFLRETSGRFGFEGPADVHRHGKPEHTFEVRVDGTIEVRIRKSGSELVQLFEDEDDLARRSPRLYKKYERLTSLEEE